MTERNTVVIGAGRLGHAIAARLAERSRSPDRTSIVLLDGPDASGDFHRRQILALAGESDEAPDRPSSVERLTGPARFENSRRIRIGDRSIDARSVILATGVAPRLADLTFADIEPTFPADLLSGAPPSTVAVIGGGPIGVGAALRLAERGSRVTLITRGPSVLRGHDADLSFGAQRWIEARGGTILPNATARTVRSGRDGVRVAIQGPAGESECEAAALAVATGFQANVEGLGIEATGLYADGGGIAVDDQMRTSVRGVWAAGFATRLPRSLALETEAGEIAADNASAPFFARRRLVPDPMPWTLPTDPPMAGLGLTETTARALHKDAIAVNVAVPVPGETGLLKLVGRKKSGEILGLHAACHGAPEVAAFFGLVQRAEISLYDLDEGQHFPAPSNAAFVHAAIRAWLAASR